MPFVYRNEPAKIDRSSKRSDEYIHENIMRALFEVQDSSGRDYSRAGVKYVKILPVKEPDPTFKEAEPNKFLATYSIKELGLTWFEVEHWLDNISGIDIGRLQFDTGSLCDVDERRRYYQKETPLRGMIITYLIRFVP
jgi:hypothetical protein